MKQSIKLKISLTIIAIFTLHCRHCFAQVHLPPVYEIKTDTAKQQILDSIYWQKLEDKDGNWTIDDVTSAAFDNKFHAKGIKAAGVDTNDIHTYWHRYRLKNTMTSDARISLTSAADFFDVFIIKPDIPVIHYRSGFLQKWELKTGLKSADWAGAIPLVLKPGEEITIYDRRNRKHDTNFRTTVRFLSTEKLVQEQYIDYVDSREHIYPVFALQEAFMIGLIFVSIFISLFFYRVVKEKVYIYFALFAFFLGINRHYNIAGDYTLWHFPSLNRYVNYIGFAWNFIPFFLIQFIRHFFYLKTKYPKWDKAIYWMGLLNLIVGCAALVQYSVSGELPFYYDIQGILFFLIIPLSIIITLLLFIKIQNQSFRYIIFGCIPLMLLYLLGTIEEEKGFFGERLASYFSVLAGNFRLIEMVLLCWMILCFVWVLIMRFDKLRKENAQQALDKERLAKEKEIERNELIAKQKSDLEKEVADRTADLKQSLEDLKSTQSQLIQSEKMASLGELTAGIAHEIQNPLNFVNNFSDVNKEMIAEMKDEIDKGNYDEVKIIASDIEANSEKINHHGQRAAAIVKGMLQHSRKSEGKKELTDINALCDEYLRLSYHGLRAKDKSFNAKFETNFDTSIPKINVVPQDIGRVILNLINNAFYAASQNSLLGGRGAAPTVWVGTSKISPLGGRGAGIEISVKDNGNGIPENIKDKIFQPFFTTKPTGSGTGLGLSLSYDIVKAHRGEIKVESKENEGSEFIIQLPVV